VAWLYFLDSGGGTFPEAVPADAVGWYMRTGEQLNPGFPSNAPELVFLHIPMRGFPSAAGSNASCWGGMANETGAFQDEEYDAGLEAAVKGRAPRAVFAGHNHGIDACCAAPWSEGSGQGSVLRTTLCNGRHTGYGGYHEPAWGMRGARVVDIEEDGSMSTWVAFEDGSHRFDGAL